MLKKLLYLVLLVPFLSFVSACSDEPVSKDGSITIDGSKATTFAYGSDMPDWTTYFKITNSNGESVIVTDSMITESVNMYLAGTYTVTINYADGEKQLSNSVTITVKPSEYPIISVNPNNYQTSFEVFEEPANDWTSYFSIIDNKDGIVTVTESMITHDINMDVVGIYTVTVSHTNSDSKTSTETLTIHVMDTTAPIISSNPNNLDTVLVLNSTVDWTKYFTVYDLYDGDITVTEDMIVTDYIDMASDGGYRVYIRVYDNNNNLATGYVYIQVGAGGIDPGDPGTIFTTNYNIFEGWDADAIAQIDALPASQKESVYSALTSAYAYTGIPTLPEVDGLITYDKIKDSLFWPENVKRIVSLVDQEMWEDTLFPHRNGNSHLDSNATHTVEYYTYIGFLQAAAKYPMFCNEDFSTGMTIDEVCAKELATMFAHFTQETGAHSAAMGDGNEARQGLYWFGEVAYHGTGNVSSSTYCQGGNWSAIFPCSEQGHYGRGAKQISWNYNYARYSMAMFGDFRLLLDPSLIETEPFLAIASAFWFYMTPTSGKPSMHDVVIEKYNGSDHGFGLTINIINGGLECGFDSAQAANRIIYYEYFMTEFGIWEDHGRYELNDCRTQGSGVSIAAYQFPMYWQKDWTGAIVPATWETGYQLLVPEAYIAFKESQNEWRYPERYYKL